MANSLSSGGKNRVVFIVRNNDESSHHFSSNRKKASGKNNSDLAHLPSYDQIRVERRSRDLGDYPIEASNSNSAQKQTVFHVGSQKPANNESNTITPIPIKLHPKGTEAEDCNKKSTSILDTSAKHSMARLIQSSISHNQDMMMQDSRNYIQRSSEAKLMTPQSSSNLQ